MNEIIYDLSKGCRLPDDGQRVLCFGHKTFCCKEDMDEDPDWHEVVFRFRVSNYRIRNPLPSDPEDSILSTYEVVEEWDADSDEGAAHVIGVTKWKALPKSGEK